LYSIKCGLSCMPASRISRVAENIMDPYGRDVMDDYGRVKFIKGSQFIGRCIVCSKRFEPNRWIIPAACSSQKHAFCGDKHETFEGVCPICPENEPLGLTPITHYLKRPYLMIKMLAWKMKNVLRI
jgi:hypothetical protein